MYLYRWCASLHQDLIKGEYKSRGFNAFTICERGKVREILSVHITERCVQKCLVKYGLKPVLMPKLIYDNSATLEGKGTGFAIKRLREHLRWHVARYGRQGGILILDYHNYFGSISHQILLDMLKPLIKDSRTFDLLSYFVNCFPGEKGLGLGSEISQICAVFYTNQLDHYIKDKLGVHGYAKYMDDSYAISQSIEELLEIKEIIDKKSKDLCLGLNPKRTCIIRFENGHFTYLKKRIHITESGQIVMRLTRKNITQRRRKVKKQIGLVESGEMSQEALRASFEAWRGYAMKCNSYQTVKRIEEMIRKEKK